MRQYTILKVTQHCVCVCVCANSLDRNVACTSIMWESGCLLRQEDCKTFPVLAFYSQILKFGNLCLLA